MNYCYGDPCQNGGTCSNLPASYVCDCMPVYIGQNCEEEAEVIGEQQYN